MDYSTYVCMYICIYVYIYIYIYIYPFHSTPLHFTPGRRKSREPGFRNFSAQFFCTDSSSPQISACPRFVRRICVCIYVYIYIYVCIYIYIIVHYIYIYIYIHMYCVYMPACAVATLPRHQLWICVAASCDYSIVMLVYSV